MSVDALNADLATVREELTRFLVPRRGGKYPKREYLDALDRVEAELSRLREQRDEYAERLAWHREERDAYMKGNLWVRRAAEERERAEAAEARCARLQQALRAIAEGNLGDAPWQANYERARQFAREALAGTDTPADSEYEVTLLALRDVTRGRDPSEALEPRVALAQERALRKLSRLNTPATDWPRFAREILDGDTDAIAARLPEFLRPDADTPAEEEA